MARRPNYGGEKRQKEMKRQKKKEEKAEKKRLRKEGVTAEDQDGIEPADPDAGQAEPDRDGRDPLA